MNQQRIQFKRGTGSLWHLLRVGCHWGLVHQCCLDGNRGNAGGQAAAGTRLWLAMLTVVAASACADSVVAAEPRVIVKTVTTDAVAGRLVEFSLTHGLICQSTLSLFFEKNAYTNAL